MENPSIFARTHPDKYNSPFIFTWNMSNKLNIYREDKGDLLEKTGTQKNEITFLTNQLLDIKNKKSLKNQEKKNNAKLL